MLKASAITWNMREKWETFVDWHFCCVYPVYMFHAAAAAKSLQSCSALCDPMDGTLPGSSVHGTFQARVLEWAAIAFSNACFISDSYHPLNPHFLRLGT